jgi:hypothetical protein
MAEAGFTSLRTYTTPPDDLLNEAHHCGVRASPAVLRDWRYLLDAGRQSNGGWRACRQRSVRRSAARRAREVLASASATRSADAVRWYGARRAGRPVAARRGRSSGH